MIEWSTTYLHLGFLLPYGTTSSHANPENTQLPSYWSTRNVLEDLYNVTSVTTLQQRWMVELDPAVITRLDDIAGMRAAPTSLRLHLR